MSGEIKLPKRVDLSSAMKLVSDLKSAEGGIKVDVSDVDHLGTLGLQALIAAARHAKENGHRFELENVPERVLGQMELMGTSPEHLMEGCP
jgi:chemotaxis protein CheX